MSAKFAEGSAETFDVESGSLQPENRPAQKMPAMKTARALGRSALNWCARVECINLFG